MADVKLSDFDTAPAITALSYFAGFIDNGDGTFTNYNFTPAQMIAYVLAQTRKVISVTITGQTLTDSFFADKVIQEIVMGGQVYVVGDHFTQSGNIITGIDIAFIAGQKIIAKA